MPRALEARSRTPLLRRVTIGLASLALLVALLIAGVLGALHHQMRASLAPLDGSLRLPGLSAPVTVRRDAHGVPHMEAATVNDALAAQGWVTASDRLWQMDMARRLPAGEAAEVLGSALVAHDRQERVLGMRDVAERMVRMMPPGELAQLEAYAHGVNAYIAEANTRGTLPAEFSLLMYKPAPWRPYDSVLIALSMSEMLDERWQAKLKREQVTARLAAHGESELAADLYPTGSWRDHPPVPVGPAISDPQDVPQIPLDPSQVRLATPLLPVRELLAAAALGESGAFTDAKPGSNEWAVSGAHTASGKPLLANDMHLDHGIPDVWYESELHAGSFHVAGVTIPGLPLIAAGHNDHIAWGFTALGGDTQDLYVEQLNAQGEYKAVAADGSGKTHWQPLLHEHERIHVRGGSDVELDVERTAHGPLLNQIFTQAGAPAGAGLGAGERRPLALHWSIYDDKAQGLPLFGLDTASDWESFRAALATWWGPTLNVAYADDAGHIGYQAVGLIPVRAGGLQGMPITPGLREPAPAPATTAPVADAARQPGSVPALPAVPAAPVSTAPVGEWTGYIPFESLPSVLDPEGGIVATANARITPDGYPYQITLEWASPYRNERIWHWLSGKKGLHTSDMITLQTDIYSEVDQEIAQRFAYAVDHAAHPSSRAREAADLLRSWDGVLAVDSPAAAIVTSTEQLFWPTVLGAKIGDGWRLYDWSESTYAREQLIAHEPAAWLPGTYRNWNDFLAALVDSAVSKSAGAPGNLRSWRYGAAHTIAIEHPLWKALPGFHSGVGPLPQSGDASTVKQVSGSLGPSQRFTADLSDLDRSTENIVMGQSEDPASQYFRDQWPYWYGDTTFSLPFKEAAVVRAAQHTLHLVP